jgi:putative peptidoglycan lipid II flippase
MADDMEQLPTPPTTLPTTPPVTPVAPATGLARNAGLLAVGSAAGRGLGLAREVMIAALFGATGEVSAFRVASQVPVLLYDFLVGGMLSAALVPVLSQYAKLRSRADFAYLVGVLATVLGLLLALMVAVLELTAPQVAWLLAAGLDDFDPGLLALTTQLIRLTTPAVWLFSMAGLATAILYALQRFTFPALATAIYNLGIVIAAPLLARRLGIGALVVGILLGATAQLVIMAIDLARAGVRVRLRFDWRHPALGQIARLYLPIALGLVVSLFQVGLDRRLASGTGAQSIAWMANATTLQQMPLGLISVAIALAALPQLSLHFAQGDEGAYRATLGRGLRMVLLLIVPAAALLWVLSEPVTRLLFERNRFTAADTAQVVAALQIYLVGMLFAAVDYPLNFALYARNNTWVPALVGVISVGVYVAVALALVGPLGFLGLVWADTVKQASHALLMGLLVSSITGTRPARWGAGLVWILAAGCLAAGVAWGAVALLQRFVWSDMALPQIVRDGVDLLVGGGLGVVVYGWVLQRAQVPEVAALLDRLRRRLG